MLILKQKGKILAFFTGFILLFLTATATLSNFSAKADNNSLTYVKFNAKTGAFLGSYILNPMPSSNNSRSNIYEDNRVIDWTKSGVVKIISQVTNGAYSIGTGFVVDEHTIATAAHVVNNTKLDRIELYDSKGNLTMSATPVESHVPYNYASAPDASKPSNMDYALVTVKEDLSKYMCFDLAVPINTGMRVSITGFPGAVYPNGGGNPGVGAGGNKYTGTGTVLSINNGIMTCSGFSSPGASGSPIYMSESYNGRTYNSVVAIHTFIISYSNQYGDGSLEYDRTEAAGPAMSFDIIHFLANNDHKSY